MPEYKNKPETTRFERIMTHWILTIGISSIVAFIVTIMFITKGN